MVDEMLSSIGVDDFKSLDENVREEYIRTLKTKGISLKKISELTGISYYMVRKICNINIY